MVTAALVEQHLTEGARLLGELDRLGIVVSTLAWVYSDEANVWNLMLSTPIADEYGLDIVFFTVLDVLEKPLPESGIPLLQIIIQRESEQIPRLLRKLAPQSALGNRWLPPTTVEGTYIENVYVYRAFATVRRYRTYFVAEELVPRRDTSYRLRLHAYPPVGARSASPWLVAKDGLPAFSRTLGISDDAAVVAPRRLLDPHGFQPRVWAFLGERGRPYVHRLIDLILDRPLRDVHPDREQTLTTTQPDFAFAALTADQLAASEFGVLTPG